jgi:hypothetical protein
MSQIAKRWQKIHKWKRQCNEQSELRRIIVMDMSEDENDKNDNLIVLV